VFVVMGLGVGFWDWEMFAQLEDLVLTIDLLLMDSSLPPHCSNVTHGVWGLGFGV